jgi:hypothetical protein
MSRAEFAPDYHPQAYTFGSIDQVVAYSRKQLVATRGMVSFFFRWLGFA